MEGHYDMCCNMNDPKDIILSKINNYKSVTVEYSTSTKDSEKQKSQKQIAVVAKGCRVRRMESCLCSVYGTEKSSIL